jgi:hydroxymethylpyrimidine pyrophosphatase-like HAD family hydrolase
MRYRVLAADYDGTLASHSAVDGHTIEALERLRRSGRHLILVTGRRLPDLVSIFPRLDLCSGVVAENGAVLHVPGEHRTTILAAAPDPRFLQALRVRGVPFHAGKVVVATDQPYEQAVLAAIKELGLDLHIVFNGPAVMVLPEAVTKASGLETALEDLGMTLRNVVGIGDAENDHAFLDRCELSAAVANALPAVRERADAVTVQDEGRGVVELIDALLRDDLTDLTSQVPRLRLMLGSDREGREVTIPPSTSGFVLAGPSASGKSTLATAFIEQLAARGYQFCVIDPEGDYERLGGVAVVGDPERAPSVAEVLRLLEQTGQDVVANLLGVPMADRPGFLAAFLPALLALRARTGRPHWLVVDEAHHVLPDTAPARLPGEQDLPGLLLLTVHPDRVAAEVLQCTEGVIAFGREVGRTIDAYARGQGVKPPVTRSLDVRSGEVVAWWKAGRPVRFRPLQPSGERRRHLRKYLRGDLGPDSFIFTGPTGALHLRAQNLLLFLQIGEGVDDGTWEFHRRRGDYSRWLRRAIKDDALAAEVERIEVRPGAPPDEARHLLRSAIEARYTI